jgi:hypothetical protein
MNNYITNFNKWRKIYESDEPSIDDMLFDIHHLVEIGVIDPSVIRDMLKEKGRDEVLQSLPKVQEILTSPDYAELQSHGLELVSSKTQLLNGNLIFGYPGYSPRDQFAIGLFIDNRKVKRMTPKNIPFGIWRRREGLGRMDDTIKEFKSIPVDQFYKVTLRWVLDHIDFTKSSNQHDLPDFPVKKRTPRGYFD